MKKLLSIIFVFALFSAGTASAITCGARCSDYDFLLCNLADGSDCSVEEWDDPTGAKSCMVNPGTGVTDVSWLDTFLCSSCRTDACGCTDGFSGSAAVNDAGECEQQWETGKKFCKNNACPSTSKVSVEYNGYPCWVSAACDAGDWGCSIFDLVCLAGQALCMPRQCELIRTEDTVWDASEGKCVRCDYGAGVEKELCADGGGIYMNIDPFGYCTCKRPWYDDDTVCGFGTNAHAACQTISSTTATCETACNYPPNYFNGFKRAASSGLVDTACDEVKPGDPCIAGEICESLGMTVECDPLIHKCNGCTCADIAGCGDYNVEGSEECDGGETLDVNNFPVNWHTAEADDQCVNNVYTTYGGSINGVDAICIQPKPSNPPGVNKDACKCQLCGNGRIEGTEQCETDADCSGVTCLSNCQCDIPVTPTPLPCGSADCDFGVEYNKNIYYKAGVIYNGVTQIVSDYNEFYSSYKKVACGYIGVMEATSDKCIDIMVRSPDDTSLTTESICVGGSVTIDAGLGIGDTGIQNVPSDYIVTLTKLETEANFGTIAADNPPKTEYTMPPAYAVIEAKCVEKTPPVTPPCDSGSEPSCPQCEDSVCCDPASPDPACPTPNSGDWECVLPAGSCSSDSDCLSDEECEIATCSCKIVVETNYCSNFDPSTGAPIDDDNDGCANGADADCGGPEDCFNGIDDNCNGLVDCHDIAFCLSVAPECNSCQNLLCAPGGAWYCQTKPYKECSENVECSTNYCTLLDCTCQEPPLDLAIKWHGEFTLCRLIVLLEGIAAGVATLMLVIAGIKWAGAGVENPDTREDAKQTVKNVFIGLIIILVALEFINYAFGEDLGVILCDTDTLSGVSICGESYACGQMDDVCPLDFGVACEKADPDCT